MIRKLTKASRATTARYRRLPYKQPLEKRGWLKRFLRSPWFIVIWPIVSFVLLQSASAIQNARAIGIEWKNFQSWLYEDAQWTGTWLPNPEGYINSEEMGVDYGNEIEPKLELTAERGEIGGTISTKGICKHFPFWDFLNVSGEASVTGKSARLEVWDYVNGKRFVFAKIELKRSDIRMDYKLLSGSELLLPVANTLWLDPASMPAPPELADDLPAPEKIRFCQEELKEYMQNLSQHTPSTEAHTD